MAAQICEGPTGLNVNAVREQAGQRSDADRALARIANEVTQGAETQTHSLDSAVSLANEMTASLGETTTQAESIAASTEELVSSVNEMAASIEQVGANP